MGTTPLRMYCMYRKTSPDDHDPGYVPGYSHLKLLYLAVCVHL